MYLLPDGSGFMVISMPLPDDHWSIKEGDNVPPKPFLLREEYIEKIREAGKYAIRATTNNGKIVDYDPDAFLQNLVVAMAGHRK